MATFQCDVQCQDIDSCLKLQVDRVIFCLFLKTDKDIYEELLQKYFAID